MKNYKKKLFNKYTSIDIDFIIIQYKICYYTCKVQKSLFANPNQTKLGYIERSFGLYFILGLV